MFNVHIQCTSPDQLFMWARALLKGEPPTAPAVAEQAPPVGEEIRYEATVTLPESVKRRGRKPAEPKGPELIIVSEEVAKAHAEALNPVVTLVEHLGPLAPASPASPAVTEEKAPTLTSADDVRATFDRISGAKGFDETRTALAEIMGRWDCTKVSQLSVSQLAYANEALLKFEAE